MDTLIKMLTDQSFDWDSYWNSNNESPDDLFRKEARLLTEEEEKGEYYQIGSCEVADTARGLYRLLFLLRPPGVDFSDMYKHQLFCFCSTDGRFVVQVYLFKYELGLYFFVRDRAMVGGQGRNLVAGWPGADNGWFCQNEQGQRFFEIVKAAVEYKWMVYGGNDFEV